MLVLSLPINNPSMASDYSSAAAAVATFQTAASLPSYLDRRRSQQPTTSSSPFFFFYPPFPIPLKKSSSRARSLPRIVSIRASSSSSATVNPSSESLNESFLERCFSGPSTSSSLTAASAAGGGQVVMKKDYGAFGTVTLQKSKLDLSQKTTRTSPELATGGGGGDIGKKNFHGGGDGGVDGGDDDDYFGDFDEGDEGDDAFDRKFVDAVLQEWYKTMMDLPAGLCQAYEMRLVSSAQMVRYLVVNARPTVSRAISRGLPESLSRAFIARMIADPSFLYKVILEQATTIGCSVWWEVKNRKGRIKQEWDLTLVNVLTVSACNAFVVWSLASCHSYGNTFHFDLQNTIQKLLNNIFEKSYPMREFDLQKRVHSFLYKAAEFCLLGMGAGAVQGALTKCLAAKREGRLSVTIPSVGTNALGYGALLGLYANLRYQLLRGIDRAMFDYFDVLGVVTVLRMALRILNVEIGERSRLAWLGVESDPLLDSDALRKVYNRNSESASDQPSSKWFISKNAIISGLGLLGIKQGNGESETAPKARRKRVVKRKMSTSTSR